MLNGSRSNTRVSQATRERVLTAARELKYHPNALARGLSGRPTRTLGVLFGLERASVAVTNPYAFGIFQGLIANAADARYNVTLFTEPWHDVERSGGILRDGSTDGVVLIAVSTDSDIIPSVTARGLPAVVVSSGAGHEIPSVDVDNSAGGRLATEHLLSLGHRRIAHLSGDDKLINAVDRRDAYCAAMDAAGLRPDPAYMPGGSYEAASGYDRTRLLLALTPRPTAIFAANDILAFAAINAAQDCGVDVPGQLSIVGFDDIPLVASGAPTLTTVRQPLSEIGMSAARTLIALVEGAEISPLHHLFEPAPDRQEFDSAAGLIHALGPGSGNGLFSEK